MSELRIPGATRASGPSVMEVARDREDVVVGDEIVRHRLSSRAIHWTVAIFFFGALLTGMPIWSPVFGWMAFLFGGLSVCRWLHAWLGVAFAAASLLMFVHWFRDMIFDKNDRRFNVLWWPTYFSQLLRSASILLHDLAFIAFFVAIVGHIYLGTAAEPGTFRAITRGTVSKAWARLHHPRWYRDVTGDRRS